MGNLTTADRVNLQLGLTDAAEISLLDDFIAEASQMIEDYCGRSFERETLTEKIAGNNTNMLFLSKFPIVEILSITHDGSAVTLTDVEISDAETGELYSPFGFIETARYGNTASRPQIPSSERRLYSIEYTAGYILPGEAGRNLPFSLERACVEMVKSMFARRKDDPSVVKETLAGVASVEYGAAQGAAAFPASVAAIIDNFRVLI